MPLTQEEKADSAAQDLVREDDNLDSDQVDMDEVKLLRFGVHSKMKPVWTEEDNAAVEAMKASARLVVQSTFSKMYDALDRLYRQARIPLTDDEGSPRKDAHGRTLWKRDDEGDVIEDWRQVTSEEIERCLLKLQELKFFVSPQVRELFLEAYFAKHAFKDDWYEAYRSPSSGTATIREALANKTTLESKYNSVYRYWVWSYADTVERELNSTQALLGRLRSWRTRDRD